MTTTWMPDGKPGKILESLRNAVKAMEGLQKKGGGKGGAGDSLKYVDADDVKRIAREAFTENGIVLDIEAAHSVSCQAGAVTWVEVPVTLRLIADDGSYITASAIGGAVPNKLGKFIAAAITAGVKAALSNVLSMVVEDQDRSDDSAPGKADDMPDTLRAALRRLWSCTEMAEVQDLPKTTEFQAVEERDRPYLRQAWRQKIDELLCMEGASRMAWERAKRMRDEQEALAKAGASSIPGDDAPIDIRDTVPLTPRRGRKKET